MTTDGISKYKTHFDTVENSLNIKPNVANGVDSGENEKCFILTLEDVTDTTVVSHVTGATDTTVVRPLSVKTC